MNGVRTGQAEGGSSLFCGDRDLWKSMKREIEMVVCQVGVEGGVEGERKV